MKRISILLVEDEQAISDMVCFALSAAPYHVMTAADVPQAKILLADHPVDVILLDWMLPGESGPAFLIWLKKHIQHHQIPIIMLTAKAEEQNKVSALIAGADDYMTKPFSPKELAARIQAILRRGPIIANQEVISVGIIKLHYSRQEVEVNNELLELTPREYKTMELFMRQKQQKFTRDILIDRLWGGSSFIDARTIDVHIRRLRDKLRPHGIAHYIHTVRGIGYFFSDKTNE